jgi:hypothetical protein
MLDKCYYSPLCSLTFFRRTWKQFTMAHQHVGEEKELDIAHIERPGADDDGTIVKTTLEDLVYAQPALSLLQTIKTYPKASFLCFIAAVSAISDGYQISMSGSIIALPGFINQFGFPIGVNGAMKLDPSHVSLFGSRFPFVPRSEHYYINETCSLEDYSYRRWGSYGNLAVGSVGTETHDSRNPNRPGHRNHM